MSIRLEDQIRHYTEAWFADATPAEQLAPTGDSGHEASPDVVSLTVRDKPSSIGPSRGLAVTLGVAVIILVATIPFSLLSNGPRASESVTHPTPLTTLSETENPFLGTWIGDDVDGSWNTLIVESNSATYQESGLSACKAEFGEFVGGLATGPTTIDGNTLTFTGTLYCNLEEGRTPHPSFENFEWVFTYDPSTGLITFASDPRTTLRRMGD